jgi:hypothetical protein
MLNILFFLIFMLSASVSFGQDLKITTDFESGSARVLWIERQSQTVRIIPAGDPARGMPNWWYFRIDGIDTTKPLLVEVEAREDLIPDELTGKGKKTSPAFTWPSRAAISTNQKKWNQTTEGSKVNNRMVYHVQSPAKTLWLAWGPPFTPTDAMSFVTGIAHKYGFARSFILAQSREGRTVPALQIAEGNKESAERPAIWISARHHAWECGGSWVGIGFTDWLVSNDQQAGWLRKNAEIFVVPVLDVDHVATGDGGKHAQPQDHNLDWSDQPHWHEVAATQKRILALAKEGRMNIFLDLHNPAPGNKQQTAYVIEKAYMPEKADSRKLRFVELMIEEFGSLKQNPAGPPAENPALFHRVSVPWVLEHSNANTIAFCIETPWNTPASHPEGYGLVGRKLGSAIVKLLQEETKQP